MANNDGESGPLLSNDIQKQGETYESITQNGNFQIAERAESNLGEADKSTPKVSSSFWVQVKERIMGAYSRNRFLILVAAAISSAYIYPPFAGKLLFPHVTASWIAVVVIFFLSGLSIKTEDLTSAFQRIYFNAFVQGFNFFVISSIVYSVSRLLLFLHALPQSLADGMVICSTLPITVNMVIVLTSSANGDVASAIFNAAFGNLIGVFLSPALILAYVGVKSDIHVMQVFMKLVLRVLVPLLVGQLLYNYVPPVREYSEKNQKKFKRGQENCLIFIIYTVFCKTFQNGSDASVMDICVMIVLQAFILSVMMVLAGYLLETLFRGQPRLQAMGVFGCTHKTAAMGVPLIGAIYEKDPLVGMYTLPLLAWHINQIFIGTAVAPHIAEYVESEELRG